MTLPSSDSIRLWRSPDSAGGDECHPSETRTANAAYTDAVLADIAAQGFNAIWLHGELRVMVPSRVFPELGPEAGEHLRNMRELIARAGRHGVRVFVYLQPPRGLPVADPFWQQYPEAGGVVTPDLSGVDIRAFCTSHDAVKDYLRDSSARVFEELPGLGGVILITASEFQAHCYSKVDAMRGDTTACPRCAGRDPVEVVAEIVRLVRDGVRSVSRTADIIVWNWSWRMYEANPNPRIIAGLPGDVILMADFERGGRRKILGRMRPIDEYSLGYVGPSATFRRSVELARRRGLRTMAKLQIGTTHELATVPNLPLIGNLYDKVKALKAQGIASFLGCWSFGCEPSANTGAFNRFWNMDPLGPKRQALMDFAGEYFADGIPSGTALPGRAASHGLESPCHEETGRHDVARPFRAVSPVAGHGLESPCHEETGRHDVARPFRAVSPVAGHGLESPCHDGRLPDRSAELVVAAWNRFGRAMTHYPFCFAFIYVSPVNYAMGLPVRPAQARKTPLGASWVDVRRGEWIESSWLDHFEWPEIPAALERLSAEWDCGVRLLENALKGCAGDHAREELDTARVVGHSFRSAWNIYRFFALRKAWSPRRLAAYRRIARDELAHLEAVPPILERDRRFGWHGECHAYLYDAAAVRRKVRALRRQLAAFPGAQANHGNTCSKQ